MYIHGREYLVWKPALQPLSWLCIFLSKMPIIEEEIDRREGKCRRFCFGDVQLYIVRVSECRTSHLAARMIWRKVFGRCKLDDNPIFRSIHFAKCPFFHSSFSSNHPVLHLQCGMGLNLFRFPTNSDDFCLSFSLYPTSMPVTFSIKFRWRSSHLKSDLHC